MNMRQLKSTMAKEIDISGLPLFRLNNGYTTGIRPCKILVKDLMAEIDRLDEYEALLKKSRKELTEALDRELARV